MNETRRERPEAGWLAGDRLPGGAEGWALGALGFILVVTAAWWALALWPTPASAPEWLTRARAVCFNTTETGLPDASGWLLLIGQPLGMTAVLLVVWTEPVLGGLRRLAGARAGRAALALVGLGVMAGIFGAAARVVHAVDASAVRLAVADLPPESYPRLDRAPPAIALVDQHGERHAVGRSADGPTLVTFAFGNCETICPLVVRNVLDARARLPDPGRFSVAVLTLDPWRDTPGRLPHMAARWELGPGDRVLGGEVDEVNEALDAWNVPRTRDRRTGDIAHPALVYLLDSEGRIAFASRGDVETMIALAGRL